MIEDLDKLYERQMFTLRQQDTTIVAFLLERRKDRLARMEELASPKFMIEFEETLIKAARDTLQDRGIL